MTPHFLSTKMSTMKKTRGFFVKSMEKTWEDWVQDKGSTPYALVQDDEITRIIY